MSKWHHKDTAPRDGTVIDLLSPHLYRITRVQWDNHAGWVDADTGKPMTQYFTHWMESEVKE